MASKQVDVGFLPPNAYVLAHEQSNVKSITAGTAIWNQAAWW